MNLDDDDYKSFTNEDLSSGKKRRRRCVSAKPIVDKENHRKPACTKQDFCSFMTLGEPVVTNYSPRVNVFASMHPPLHQPMNNHAAIFGKDTCSPLSSNKSIGRSTTTPLSNITNVHEENAFVTRMKRSVGKVVSGSHIYNATKMGDSTIDNIMTGACTTSVLIPSEQQLSSTPTSTITNVPVAANFEKDTCSPLSSNKSVGRSTTTPLSNITTIYEDNAFASRTKRSVGKVVSGSHKRNATNITDSTIDNCMTGAWPTSVLIPSVEQLSSTPTSTITNVPVAANFGKDTCFPLSSNKSVGRSTTTPLSNITTVYKENASVTRTKRSARKVVSGSHKRNVTNITDSWKDNSTTGACPTSVHAPTVEQLSSTSTSTITNVSVQQQFKRISQNNSATPTSATQLFTTGSGTEGLPPVNYDHIEVSEIYGLTDFVDDSSILEADIETETEDEIDECVDEMEAVTLGDPWCQKMIDAVPKEYKSLGAPTAECSKCHAKMWKEERTNKQVTKKKPQFSLCCRKGRVNLSPALPTPPFLLNLYNSKSKGSHFRKCIRMYNSMFSFTSMGGNVDRSVNKGGAPFVYRLNGQNHHQFGALLPREGSQPRFCQLYIYDTENEIGNRMRCININDTNNVDAEVVEGLLNMLDHTNHLVKCFRMARDRFRDDQIVDLKIVLKASRSESGRDNHISPSNEVAAVMVGDIEDTCGQRDIVIDSKIDGLQRISDIHPLLMALQYPLLFPYGEDGFHEKMYYVKQPNEPPLKRDTVSMREYYAYRLQIRPHQGMTLRLGGRLYQQFVVDSFSAIEQSRLWYIRCNQKTLRNELYSHICDFFKEGDGDMSNVGRGFILPSSFVGSKRYLQQNFQDAMAVCRHIGHPDLFLTMTCNPMWDEVLQMLSLLPGCRPVDCPDIIARVFKLKLRQIKDDIKKKKHFGKCIAIMYVVEWQKRGLPHVHMLIWLDSASKIKLNQNVDKFVSAEIPDSEQDPYGYAAVQAYMIHGPCGLERPKSPCMKDHKCSRHFPKRYSPRTVFDESGFPVYMRRKTKNVVNVRKATLDNQWVVPYNRNLLVKYQCHINVEICNRARCLKYLFKYCLKGSDRATVEVTQQRQTENEAETVQNIDEIKNFFDGRYVCGAEAAHRIFAFDIHHRSVSVERLPFHLEGQKPVTYKENDCAEQVIKEADLRPSKLEAYFILNQHDTEAHNLSYDQIPQKYVWDKEEHIWSPRKRGLHIGRLTYTHHTNGELWYLRMLLSKVCGATSYEELRTVDGIVLTSFQEACNALGLLDSDKEWHECIKECDKSGFPPQIRNLFVQLIVNCKVSDLRGLWISHWRCMSEDILHTRIKLTGNRELKLTDEQLQWYTLAEIDTLLRAIGKKLEDYGQLPQPPPNYMNASRNSLIIEETQYDTVQMAAVHKELLLKCNADQRAVYDSVLDAVYNKKGGLFFVYGSGGCGKTFLWNTLITRLRSESRIVLPVASSGIAATLLPGGRTAHSRFKIPILLDELSCCSIGTKSDIADLIKRTELIVWDEAPMQHRFAFEALDRTLRDIMRTVDNTLYTIPFGGIPVLLGGDFRQILPVIKWGSRSDIVSACITNSSLWRGCVIHHLNQNMRLLSGGTSEEQIRIKKFGEWLLDVGNGNIHTYRRNKNGEEEQVVQFPKKNCIPASKKAVNDMIDSTYPNLIKSYQDSQYLSARAILTPTNHTVGHINNLILNKIPGEIFNYYSADKAEAEGSYDAEIDRDFPVEYLNSLTYPGLPLHQFQLKVGAVVMLMRNLNQILGLCNGTRLIVRKCLKHAVECEVLSGNALGTRHFIPRMDLSPTDSKEPYKLICRQFPLQLCYAMTINKAQGQSLKTISVYLPKSVFSHGQLYVALSRVSSADGFKVLIESDDGRCTNSTPNVVYAEVFDRVR